jgi:hypothetical protein
VNEIKNGRGWKARTCEPAQERSGQNGSRARAGGRNTHNPYNKEYRPSHQRGTLQAHQPPHTHTQLTSAQYRALSNCRRFSTQRAQHDTIHGRRGAVIVHTAQYNCSARTTQAAYMGADLLDVLLLLAQQRVEVLLVHDLHVRLCAQQGTYSEGYSTGHWHKKTAHARCKLHTHRLCRLR